MSILTGNFEVIPAASFNQAAVTFLPVPATLQPWIHSIWTSLQYQANTTHNERYYPDGGTSLTFGFVPFQVKASVHFSTVASHIDFPGADHFVSFRFRAGAFAECFRIASEALPQDLLVDFDTLLPGLLPPAETLCRLPVDERVSWLQNWIVHQAATKKSQLLMRQQLLMPVSQLTGSLSEPEQHLGFSTRTYQRKFRQAFGLAPKRMLDFNKIHTARKLLIYTQHELSEVALMAGYYDQSHLTNHFHQFVGETPGQYRQRKQKLSRFSNK